MLDIRAAEDFADGHIPGAVHLDLWGLSLVDTDPGPLKAFMWIVDHLFNLRGVDANTPVVVYDDQSGMRAARAFWFLEYFGHQHVQVLDGGFGAWIKAGLPVAREAAPPPKSTWAGTPQPETIATWRDVKERIGKPGRRDPRHAQRRGVPRHARARETRRRAFPARRTSSGSATSPPTARSSRPRSCARCTSRPASRRTRKS